MKLPDELSALLELALGDLRKSEIDDRYTVNMGVWHVPDVEGCSVCLAGSVLAHSLDVPIDEPSGPSYVDDEIERKLEAIDELRLGNVLEARRIMLFDDFAAPDVARYDVDRDQFFADMEKLVVDLREAGL